MNSTYCEDCGTFLTAVNIWPFCRGDATKHTKVEHFSQDPMEQYVEHNLTHAPVEITTRSQRSKMMDKLGVEPRKPQSFKAQRAANRRLYFFTS
jgi:hypothetical protein